ncbi:MAG: HEAT repeat domain-containing protein [Methylococcaceae bacterium]
MALIKQTAPETITQDERATPRDFEGLCQELNSENQTARRWAVRDLGQFSQASETLVSRLKIEDHPTVRTAILDTLAQLGDDVAISGIVECLRSDEASLRNEAIEVLKNIPEQVAPIIDNLLNDADSDVRIFAVNILESLHHEDVEKWLIQVIANDEHLNVCATAVDLLSEVGTELSLEALEHLKMRFADEPYICFSVDLALKRIGQGDR